MNIYKIKEMLKNKKVQIITGSVAGVLVLTLAGTMLVHNKKAENKNIAIEKNTEKDKILDDKKEKSTNEDKDNKEKLEELKKIDTSNLSDEEKKDLENKIADAEKKVANNDNGGSSEEVTSNTPNLTSNSSSNSSSEPSSSQTSSNSGTSNSSQSSGSTTINQTSSENSNSNGGSTSGGTSTQTHTHTHNWVPITTVVHHNEEGHWENVLVSEAWTEEVPIYEEREVMICNDCGVELSVSNCYDHIEEHLLNGGKGSWREEWKQVQVGTNKINHDAVYDKKWVVDKAAWDETVTTGYRCSSCGETK